MGNVSSAEHKRELASFRAIAIGMIDTATQYAILPKDHISLHRLGLLREQLQQLPLPMLAYFTKKWVNACQHAICQEVPDDMDVYIEGLKTVKLKLPEHGTGVDVYNVFIGVPKSQKIHLLYLVHLTHQQALRATKTAESPHTVPRLEVWV